MKDRVERLLDGLDEVVVSIAHAKVYVDGLTPEAMAWAVDELRNSRLVVSVYDANPEDTFAVVRAA